MNTNPQAETITIEVTQKQLEDLIRALDYGQMHLHQLDATIGGNTEVNEAWRDRSERFGRLRKYLLWA